MSLRDLALMQVHNSGMEHVAMTELFDLEDDTPFVSAVLSSGLVAPNMSGLLLDNVDLTNEDLHVIVRASRGIHAGDAWIRGDLMLHIKNTKYKGEDIPRADLMQYADWFGCHYKRLLNNMTTSAAWPIDSRMSSSVMTNTHHEVMNALSVEERVLWIERVVGEKMSAMKLRQELAQDGLVFKKTHDEQGNHVGYEAEFISEKFDPNIAIGRMWEWYENELENGVTPRNAFENVLNSFRTAGLISFPSKNWLRTMIGKDEEEDYEL